MLSGSCAHYYDPVGHARRLGLRVITLDPTVTAWATYRPSTRTIALHAGLDLARARVAVAHIVVHVEQGAYTSCSTWTDPAELDIHRIAARRLICPCALNWAYAEGHPDPAATLGVDPWTLQVRLASLDQASTGAAPALSGSPQAAVA